MTGCIGPPTSCLGNEAGEDATKVQRRFDGLVAAITRHRAKAGSLAGAI